MATHQNATVTGKEIEWSGTIVSETDLTGKITHANDVFQHVAQYSEGELMGAAHSIVRHPDMPRCVFKLLWDTLGAGKSISACRLRSFVAATERAEWVAKSI